MRITHIISGLGRGGAENALYRLIKFQRQHYPNYQHDVISLSTNGDYGPALEKEGIKVKALGMRNISYLPIILIKLLYLLFINKPHIVQTWMVHADLLGGIASKLIARTKLIWGVRTTDYSVESLSTRLIHRLCAVLSSFLPDKVVCAAHASLRASLSAGYCASKLMVIQNGFDIDNLTRYQGSGSNILSQLGVGNNRIIIGTMGRYNPAKDHANFVKAAGIIASTYPECLFLMVGRDLNNENEELLQLITATGFAERFLLLGERTDPAACLDAMDVFVLSSCTEGFPNVLAEAMCMELACVTTDVGDAASLLGSCGKTVSARDALALASAIEDILKMPPEERILLGKQASQNIKNNYSIASNSEKFAQLYKQLSQNS